MNEMFSTKPDHRLLSITGSWPTRFEQHIQSINSPKKVVAGRIGTNIVVQNTQKH